MSPQEQQAVIDRLKREHADLTQELKVLKIEIDSIGRTLITIGRTLLERPNEIYVITDVRPDANPLFEHAQKHVDRLRELEKEIARRKDELRSIGVHVD